MSQTQKALIIVVGVAAAAILGLPVLSKMAVPMGPPQYEYEVYEEGDLNFPGYNGIKNCHGRVKVPYGYSEDVLKAIAKEYLYDLMERGKLDACNMLFYSDAHPESFAQAWLAPDGKWLDKRASGPLMMVFGEINLTAKAAYYSKTAADNAPKN